MSLLPWAVAQLLPPVKHDSFSFPVSQTLLPFIVSTFIFSPIAAFLKNVGKSMPKATLVRFSWKTTKIIWSRSSALRWNESFCNPKEAKEGMRLVIVYPLKNLDLLLNILTEDIHTILKSQRHSISRTPTYFVKVSTTTTFFQQPPVSLCG
ncbi:unnamed protein product [Lactuca virosa]|uniref:Uncharacterized protein n=1 Tax=Lactuca virosa TaxID=75947 RepID=A0AAU9MPS6_9ASTR|nr:unnamed protein product [Lactuca virosa]